MFVTTGGGGGGEGAGVPVGPRTAIKSLQPSRGKRSPSNQNIDRATRMAYLKKSISKYKGGFLTQDPQGRKMVMQYRAMEKARGPKTYSEIAEKKYQEDLKREQQIQLIMDVIGVGSATASIIPHPAARAAGRVGTVATRSYRTYKTWNDYNERAYSGRNSSNRQSYYGARRSNGYSNKYNRRGERY